MQRVCSSKPAQPAHVSQREPSALSQDATYGGHMADNVVIFPTTDQTIDALSRLKTLEDEMAKSLKHISFRLETLEAKLFASAHTDADLPEKIRSTPSNLRDSSSSLALEETSSIIPELSHRDTSAPPRKSSVEDTSAPPRKSLVEDTSAPPRKSFVKALDKFVIGSLPLKSRHKKFHFPLHTCFRLGCFTSLMMLFFLYTFWGFIKLCTPVKNNEMEVSDFVEIQHERKLWRGDEVPAPKTLCVGEIAQGLEVTAEYSIIPQGDFSRRVRTSLPLVNRDVITRSGINRNATCITSQPSIVGHFGDPWYKYISFTLSAPANAGVRPRAALLAETSIGAFQKANVSIYYTFSDAMWTGIEVLLARKVSIEGDWFGISTLLPAKYEEYMGKEGLAVESHYNRMEKSWIDPKTNKQEFASFYIRAAEVEQEDTYSPYGVLRLLMDSGGLWTALSLVAVVSILSSFYCGRGCVRINRIVRGMCETSQTCQSEVHEEQASASSKMDRDEHVHDVPVLESKESNVLPVVTV